MMENHIISEVKGHGIEEEDVGTMDYILESRS